MLNAVINCISGVTGEDLQSAGAGRRRCVRDALCWAIHSPILQRHRTSGSMTLRAAMAKSPRGNVCFVDRVEITERLWLHPLKVEGGRARLPAWGDR